MYTVLNYTVCNVFFPTWWVEDIQMTEYIENGEIFTLVKDIIDELRFGYAEPIISHKHYKALDILILLGYTPYIAKNGNYYFLGRNKTYAKLRAIGWVDTKHGWKKR